MSVRSADHVRFADVETISNGWYKLRKYTLDYRRRDGTWQRLRREACHRGDSVAVLVLSPWTKTIVLTRQFRLPAFVDRDHDGMLLEAPGGIIGEDTPEQAARREVEEETGCRVASLRPLMVIHSCPTLVTEQVHLFVAEVASDRPGPGGGIAAEGEDIEIVEIGLDEACDMVARGEIVDAKTIILIYHARFLLSRPDGRVGE
jgi:nudix-type nucleoside diphosphatase (YffH/AdpP family)